VFLDHHHRYEDTQFLVGYYAYFRNSVKNKCTGFIAFAAIKARLDG